MAKTHKLRLLFNSGKELDVDPDSEIAELLMRAFNTDYVSARVLSRSKDNLFEGYVRTSEIAAAYITNVSKDDDPAAVTSRQVEPKVTINRRSRSDTKAIPKKTGAA